MAAEAEGVGQAQVDVGLDGDVGRVVQVALGIRRVQVDRRRDDALLQGQHGGDGLDGIAAKRKTMVSTGDRSAKIRTYNYPQGRVTDHRINWSMYNLPVFMDGDIQECIDQLQIAENAERLKEAGD